MLIVLQILLELTEEVCRRARSKHLCGSTVSLGCRGADLQSGGGFSRQMKLFEPTNDTRTVYQAVCQLFERHWQSTPVRSIGVTLEQLTDDRVCQLSLFEDKPQQRSLASAIDAIRAKYGNAAILWGVSALQAGQAKERAQKIGGHYK